MIDARQFVFNIGCGDHIAIGKVPKIQLHAGLKTPIEGHLVDGRRRFLMPQRFVHGAMKMVGRIQMRAVVRA